MMVFIGAPFDFAFMQEHFEMSRWVSLRVYGFDIAACITALIIASLMDRRAKLRRTKSNLLDESDSLGQVASE